MTLWNCVKYLKEIAMRQPSVRSTGDGSIYDFLNTKGNNKYCVVFISQTTHRQDDNFDYYGFNIFFVDRLDDSMENNRLQVQSVGKEVLSNIVRTFCNTYDCGYSTLRFTPFTEKFIDITCGMYVNVEFEIPLDTLCEEEY